MDLLAVDDSGLACTAGGFHVDPWRGVDTAVITHAHSDHAREGSGRYIAHRQCVPLLRRRLGAHIDAVGLEYDEPIDLDGVRVSLHPAGHVLGSAQVRVESASGEVWVVSGDYKCAPERTVADFQPVACDTFITESTFGLPIYRWPEPNEVAREINVWWRSNIEEERTSLLYAYSLGKAQRVLALLDPSIGPIGVHGAVDAMNRVYRDEGVDLPETVHATAENAKSLKGNGVIVAPPSAAGSGWQRKFRPFSDAAASGWMRIRGTRRRRALDRGFVLSDHADWDDLLRTIEATGATRIGVTHGYAEQMARYLNERGVGGRTVSAFALRTRYVGEVADEAAASESEQ